MADVSLLAIYVVANFTVAYASYRSLPAHLKGDEYADVDDDGANLITSIHSFADREMLRRGALLLYVSTAARTRSVTPGSLVL